MCRRMIAHWPRFLFAWTGELQAGVWRPVPITAAAAPAGGGAPMMADANLFRAVLSVRSFRMPQVTNASAPQLTSYMASGPTNTEPRRAKSKIPIPVEKWPRAFSRSPLLPMAEKGEVVKKIIRKFTRTELKYSVRVRFDQDIQT